MPLQVSRLRRWFALAAIVLILAVAGLYLRLRSGVQDVLKHVPNKIGLDIQQTAEGFKVSKSEQGRTIFTIEAKKAVQFKQGGHAELHGVTITLYGRDASRFDQIYGDQFEYDPQAGDVTAKGEVRIDLEANPQGILKPDQAAPTDLKNPIHLVTRDLVFNQKTGNAYTKAQVDIDMPQAAGSAVGVRYTEKDGLLRLESKVHFVLENAGGAVINAVRAAISKEPRQVLLDAPRITHGAERVTAAQATLFVRPNNTVERIEATGGVQAEVAGKSPIHATSSDATLELSDERGQLRTATFVGNVDADIAGDQPSHANAGRVLLTFAAGNLIEKIRAEENVRLVQKPQESAGTLRSDAQAIEVHAPAIDFDFAHGRHLHHAQTSPGSAIILQPTAPGAATTTITAGRFDASFDAQGQLTSMQGSPPSKIVSATPGQPDRISTSQKLDLAFLPRGGIDSIVQQGDVSYSDGELQAHADRAAYAPAPQVLTLTGSPRVVDRGMATTARTMRVNRATGDATAEGSVKTTYSDLREQPTGALLAASSPIHVTAQTMSLHRTSSVALYTGNARLWQDANVVQAPSIEFDRDHRSVVAQGNGDPVSTVLVQVDKKGTATPVAITAKRLTYTDDQHRAHYEGGVVVRGADGTVTSSVLDAYLVPRGQSSASKAGGQGQLDRIVAQGGVVVQEPSRRATGDQLVYTAAEDKFVLTGGPPSIFDAEHGKITGDSLTFYKRDDRVLVEGREASPTVTTTRVAR